MKIIIKRHICILPRRRERKGGGRRRNKSTRATPYIRRWHTPIHCEDLCEEPLTPCGWWCLSTEEARTRLLKGEGFSHLLTWMLHVPATFLYIFFLIYQKTILLLTQHDINEKTNMKISKNPLMQVIYIFAYKGALVIALCFWKEKTKKNTNWKLRKLNI